MIITRLRQTNFAIIPNSVAEDSRISFEARGVLCYLLAKPNDWRVKIGDLQRAGGIGKDKVYRILNELLAAGYIERRQSTRGDGTFGEVEYVVYDDPVPDQLPFPENPDAVQPLSENPDAVAPRPENPHPDKPLPANPDALIRNQTLPRTHSSKTPLQCGPSRFEELWKCWPMANRPDNRPMAESLFLALPADIDRRLAIETAPLYIRKIVLRSKRPAMIPYLRQRAWRELLDDPPPFDKDGDFIITPDRPEWGAWIEEIRAVHGATFVLSTQRSGRIVRPDRWPLSGRPAEQLSLAVTA